MKAYLINPFDKTITEVDYNGKFEQAYKLMDCSMIEFERYSFYNHILMLDEEGMYKKNQKYFTVTSANGNSVSQFINRAILVGGKTGNKDVTLTLDEVKALVRF